MDTGEVVDLLLTFKSCENVDFELDHKNVVAKVS
jgi:hypothetical protein